ncbi:MAG: hypothetical protein J1F11_10525 [Oscillospiraceae bacterium]|nr:hypothetical protein [Oscillospiraceae bacterium]
MQISNIQSGQNSAVYGVRLVSDISEKEPEKVEGSGERSHGRDEYIPSEKDEPIGLYALSQDDEGDPKIYHDSPEKSESCTGNTDKVDREIERLRKRAEQIEQRLASAEGKERERLEQQLKSVQTELSQKDNDNYRRQHTMFS